MSDCYDVVIIGAGPVGLFAAFNCGLLGLKCIVVDARHEIGGQCSALYPEKPIFDIPGIYKINASDLINNLKDQVDRFNTEYCLNFSVDAIDKVDDVFNIKGNNGIVLQGKTVILSCGSGLIDFNKIPLEAASQFENKSLFYSVNDKSVFKDKKVVIFGGGDSAIDWAIELSDISKNIIIVHRRDSFSAAQASVDALMSLSRNGNIDVVMSAQLHDLIGENGILQHAVIKNSSELQHIECDNVLAFFGLSSKNLLFSKIQGLETKYHNAVVDPCIFETNIKNLFAVGDCCIYNNKQKLILCGFSEASMALRYIAANVFGKRTHQHSTSLSCFS